MLSGGDSEPTCDLDSITVLLVDQHPGMRMVWFALLHGFGIRNIIQQDTLDNLLPVIKERAVDLLVIDFRMNGMDTTGVIRAIRRAGDDPIRFLPIIACTAATHPRAISRLADAGVDEILAKPISIKEAARKFEAVINHRRHFVTLPGYFGPVYRKPLDSHPPSALRTLEAAREQNPRAIQPPVSIAGLRQKIQLHKKTLLANAIVNEVLEESFGT